MISEYDICDYQKVGSLLKEGHDPNCFDKEKRSPLMLAAQYKRADICKLLVQAGARVNFLDNKNRTALFYAAEDSGASDSHKASRIEYLVEYIISSGVDMTVKDTFGMTALDYALRQSCHKAASAIFFAQLQSDLPLQVRENMVTKYRHCLRGESFYQYLQYKYLCFPGNIVGKVNFLNDLILANDGKPDTPLSKYVHFAKNYTYSISEIVENDLKQELSDEWVQKALAQEKEKKSTVFNQYVPAGSGSSSSNSNVSTEDLIKRIVALEEKVAQLENSKSNTNSSYQASL